MEWPGNIEVAKTVQDLLREKVRIIPLGKEPGTIAGVDASFAGDRIIAVASLYEYPSLRHIEDAFAAGEVPFPYIPGLLSFREGPVVIDAIGKLRKPPDLVLFDGQGIAHPKGLGLASHIGALLDIPAVGCAKSRLVGSYTEPGARKGDWSPLKYRGAVVGAVVRTREGVKPVFVSPGHRVDLEASIRIVLACTGKYRIPEPLRRADAVSREMKKEKGIR